VKEKWEERTEMSGNGDSHNQLDYLAARASPVTLPFPDNASFPHSSPRCPVAVSSLYLPSSAIRPSLLSPRRCRQRLATFQTQMPTRPSLYRTPARGRGYQHLNACSASNTTDAAHTPLLPLPPTFLTPTRASPDAYYIRPLKDEGAGTRTRWQPHPRSQTPSTASGDISSTYTR
jgi:hypothetical protein